MKNMKKRLVLSIFILCLVFSAGCGGIYPNKGLNIIIHQNRPELSSASVLVFKFKEPDYALGSGLAVGQMFHRMLLKHKKFRVVSMWANTGWDRYGRTEEEQLMIALDEGKGQKVDYILLGEVKEYFYGGITQTRVKVTVRIIEVRTRVTVFFAENYKADTGQDPYTPMDTKMARQATVPQAVAEKLVRELVKKI